MLKLALVGKNISHSKSQQMYESILEEKVDYTLLDYPNENEIPKISELLENFSGISITSPYKKHFLSQVKTNEFFKEIEAINCIGKNNKGIIEGTNTDYLALAKILTSLPYESFVVLGDGTMSRVCLKILNDLNKSITQFSRKQNSDISKLDLTEYKNSVILNTCAREFLFKGKLDENSLFYDLNYNMKDQNDYISSLNVEYVDGIDLLKEQAREALKFWKIL